MLSKVLSYIQSEWIIKFSFFVLLKLSNPRKKYSLKYIEWNGLEIWAFWNPLFVDESRAQVKYVDYLPPDQIKDIIEGVKGENPVHIDYCLKADELTEIPDNSQDFLIANHVFEHLRDPIKTIIEWNRVLKKWGILFLTVPDMRRTFDIFRARTPLEHIVLDYKEPSLDRDFEAYKEFAHVTLGDTKWVLSDADIEAEAKRLIETDYSIHYHVFLEQDVLDIFTWCRENNLTSFELIDVKHTSAWNISDNEFTLILRK